jgi:hypothetical protein
MHYLDDPAELDQLLELDAYIAAMHALGLRPLIDVGLPRADGNDWRDPARAARRPGREQQASVRRPAALCSFVRQRSSNEHAWGGARAG